MDYLLQAVTFFLHLDKYLIQIFQNYGAWTYGIVSFVIFAETGFVVTPFLPGDSLIFVVGAFCSAGWLKVLWFYLFLLVAGIAGNTVNYFIGAWIGPKVFEHNYRLLSRKYLLSTRSFFDKHGTKTIVVARFLPIVRTFAPFLAGVVRMNYVRFSIYNAIGCFAWVTLFLWGGYFFGNIPIVRRNLATAIMVIVLTSFIPSIVGFFRSTRATDKSLENKS